MVSVTSWLTLLAAVSAPLVATAHGVIAAHAVAAASTAEITTIQPLVDGSLATSSVLTSDEDAYAHGSSLEVISANLEDGAEEHGRSLLRSRKRRGVARASPKAFRRNFKKKFSKKKSKKGGKRKKGGKKKGGKKKGGKKKGGKKKGSKKSSKKKSFLNKIAGGPKKSTGKTLGIAKKAHGTFFSGMGSPTGGCGVPPGKAYDDNGKQLPFVALNTNSEFAYGSNCGRWVEITLEENCVGAGNSQYSPCNGGKFVRDGMSGQKINGYVMDSCADSNFWCQDDTYHLDISKPYLTAMGYIGGSKGSKNWNGRKISWKYMSGVPAGWAMRDPKFMWKKGSKWIKNGKGFYAAIVAYNTANGIGAVQQKSCGKWVNVRPLNHLGNMWVLEKPCDAEYRKPNGGAGQKICVRVMDINGSLYGEYCLVWECGGTGSCPSEVDALTYKQ